MSKYLLVMVFQCDNDREVETEHNTLEECLRHVTKYDINELEHVHVYGEDKEYDLEELEYTVMNNRISDERQGRA